MNWPTYVPERTTLVILFKIARARLMASSQHVALLTDARLLSVTEEFNKISDDIRAAGHQFAHTDQASPGCAKWSRDAELSIPDLTVLTKVAAWAELRHAVNTGTEAPHPHARSSAQTRWDRGDSTRTV
jgi:hypothetical protein